MTLDAAKERRQRFILDAIMKMLCGFRKDSTSTKTKVEYKLCCYRQQPASLRPADGDYIRTHTAAAAAAGMAAAAAAAVTRVQRRRCGLMLDTAQHDESRR